MKITLFCSLYLPILFTQTLQANFDFSKGSDQRLYESISDAQADRYHEVVNAYIRECYHQPRNTTLARERIAFIEFFLYSEDFYIETVDTDLESAVDYLETTFPDSPLTILYQIDQLGGDEMLQKARAYLRQQPNWSKENMASLNLKLAYHYTWAFPNSNLAMRHAQTSFSLHPQAESGLILAEKQIELGHDSAAAITLFHEVFLDAQPLQRKRQMSMLFELDEVDPAILIYDEIKDNPDIHFDTASTLETFTKQGLFEEARNYLKEIETNEWTVKGHFKTIFEFELKHGTPKQALWAYNLYRDLGYTTDPLGYHRYRVALKSIALPWRVRDAGAFLVLISLTLLCGIVPLILIVPVHYWSLLSDKRGKTKQIWHIPWGLKRLWVISALIIVADVLLTWAFSGEAIQSYFSDAYYLAEETISDSDLISWSVLSVVAWLLIISIFIVRDKTHSLFGFKEWSIFKTIGTALMAVILFRFITVFYPNHTLETAQGSPMLDQLFGAIFDNYGFGALLFFTAVLIPIAEEFFFRGVLLSAMAKHIPFLAANIIQSVLFFLIHEDWSLFIFYIAFGLFCGEFFRRSKSLLTPLLFHAGNNAIASLGYLIISNHR